MANRLKIKPESFKKRQQQSKTYKDWNDERGSAAYIGTKKRKNTVIDECERCYTKSRVLNQNTRIDGSEDLGTAIMKISDGNFATGMALLTVASKTDVSQTVSCLLSLDSLGLYGQDVYRLWEDSNENPEEFIEKVECMSHGE